MSGTMPHRADAPAPPASEPSDAPRLVGRYMMHGRIAAGGMAAVHLGRLLGPEGFSRTVAIKRLHPQYESDPEFVAMFLDEARIAARIRHPNVVPTLDVVASEGELLLVMDYVEGESLSRLLYESVRQRGAPPDPRIAAAIVCDALHGLHAAHEARGDDGEPLGIVHRDVSPQNVMVGADGVARVLDFGIAKAVGRSQATRAGQLKGKLPYMAPEQLRYQPVTPRTDVYAAGVVLFEALTAARLFSGDDEEIVAAVLEGKVPAPSSLEPSVPAALDAVVWRATHRDPAQRYGSAREMALEIERSIDPASTSEVAEWVKSCARAALDERAERVASVESSSPISVPVGPRPALRRPAWLLLGTLVVASGALTAWVVFGRSGTTSATGASSTPAIAASPSIGASTEPAPSPSSIVPSAKASASTSTKPPAIFAPKCTPPFYFKDGIKLYKPGCLR
jgi:serine/threonine protein kinase